MKNSSRITMVFLSFILLFVSCKKEEPATVADVSTADVSLVTGTTATSGGDVSNDGGAAVTKRGVCWSTSASPTESLGTKTSNGSGTGTFTSNITELSPGTTYHIRAYATNSVGTAYGSDITFTTPNISTITTSTVSDITSTTATGGGSITTDGGSGVTEKGVCWSTTANPTISLITKTSDGTGTGSFTSNITGLTAGTTYHVRAYATNSVGTSYGNDLTFTTLGSLPTVATELATDVTVASATLKGTVNANYLSTTVSFEYGITTDYGSTVTTTQSPVTGNTSTSVSAGITGLTSASIYHYRLKAVNSLGTTYGSDMTFTTLGAIPTATTVAAASITNIGAQLKGTVNANYLSTTVTFEYGTTTSYGSTATAIQSPITGSSSTSVSASLTGLTAATTYHYRVKAVNSLGTTHGSDMTFTTLGSAPTVTTAAATSITNVAAQLNGTVNANYLSSVVTFEYGKTTSYGSTATATQSPVSGNTNTSVSSGLSGLTYATTYHYRVKAVNSIGTTYGSDMTFTTFGAAPTATATAASNVTNISAQLNGTVNANYYSTSVSFEYGLTTSYGSTVMATQSPVTGSINKPVSIGITGLTPSTTYHYRIKAVNSLGTTYSTDRTFTTTITTLGATYAGGIVFYLDNTGQHGLVCAPSDQTIGSLWYRYPTYITTNATGTEIGTGQANTTAIVTVQGAGSYAAQICNDLVLGGYSDWFLPSIDELSRMYTNLKYNGIGGFADGTYWSSSESSLGEAHGWNFLMNTKYTVSKSYEFRVRAVRAF